MSNIKQKNTKSSLICYCLQKNNKKNLNIDKSIYDSSINIENNENSIFSNKQNIIYNNHNIIYYTHNTDTIIRHLNRSIKNKQNNILIGSKSSSLPEDGWIHSCYFCHCATYNYYIVTEYSNIFICNNCKKHKSKIVIEYLNEILEYVNE